MSSQKVLTGLLLLSVILLVAACVVQAPAQQQAPEAATPAEQAGAAGEAPAGAGQQVPITILINESPWYGGFEAVVEMYEAETGNVVNLDVTPYGGVLEKARNAVRDSESTYDLVNLDTQWTIEFYDGGFLTPLD